MPRKTKYSASRVSTFHSCTMKYSLSYKRGYYAEEKNQNVLTRKGNAFHEFAEYYRPDWSDEKVEEYILHCNKKYNLPEEFDLHKGAHRFVKFYEEVIQPVVDDGGTYHTEIQFDFELDGNQFTGKLDILLEDKDGNFWIIDHKTGRSTGTSYYKKQLLLYAWGVHKQFNVPQEDMTKRIKASVFFPNGEPEATEIKKIFKNIRFGENHLEEVRDHFKVSVHTIESDWTPESTLNRMCDFCGFAGFPEYCKVSADAGVVPTRGTVIKQRDWAIRAGIK